MYLRSRKTSHTSSSDVITSATLPCSICDADLINEPCSIRCDAASCKRLFHPSCLGNSAPLDSELWFCQDCQSTEPIIDQLDSSNSDDSATARAIREARIKSDLQDKQTPEENEICSCNKRVSDDEDGLYCDSCQRWFHIRCIKVSKREFRDLQNNQEEYCCPTCSVTRSNKTRISWSDVDGLEEISRRIEMAHQELVKWNKNNFLVPRGKVGKTFITELNRLFQLFNNKTAWEPIAIHLIQIFVPLMLQKPSAKSKNKDHIKYLEKRLDWWKKCMIKELIDEGKAIQKSLTKSNESKRASELKAFTRLMLQGKLKEAIKFVNADDSVVGVHELTPDIIAQLEKKHPKAEQLKQEALIPEQNHEVQAVLFERIDSEIIMRCAKNIHGSGGPSQIDAETWKHMICSKAHGNEGAQLSEEIAILARRLCSEEIPFEYISTMMSCRLVPLKKSDNSVRPVGIGETLRRIIAKAVTMVLKDDIVLASGCLQTCAGLDGGIEAAVHAMRKIFETDECDAVILVDAENAFNKLNREAALKNIKQLCPSFHQYLRNSYKNPAKLFLKDGSYILSQEGVTQGDPAAMAKYSLASKPLITKLSDENPNIKQVWYADDGTGAGNLEDIRTYWDGLNKHGPAFGYFPKAAKSVLIVKDPSKMMTAKSLFEGIDIQITCEGQRHLGAAIGTEAFKDMYVGKKVEKWVEDIEKLAEMAKAEPQAALAAFSKGIASRWTYLQRTIPNTAELFKPLEAAIKDKFLPSLIGREISILERRMLALPYRYGGLAVRNPVATADEEYEASSQITSQLTELIFNQNEDASAVSKITVQKAKLEVRKAKEEKLKTIFDSICKLLPTEAERYLQTAAEKGASSWLAVLPLKSFGYSMNKREFQDAIKLRYGWSIPDMPQYCGCGKRNSIEHTLDCKLGGYVHIRHNYIRDTEARIMREVAFDVSIEPGLEKVSKNVRLAPGTKTEDNARLDVSARGIFSSHERTFFDVRITNPNAPSNRSLSIAAVYEKHEKEKMRAYNDRVLQVEKASFVPLVYTTSGGMSPQCVKTHKRIAGLVADKRKEKYSDVINHIRTRLRFALLKSILVAVRGARGKTSLYLNENNLGNISFNLIPFVPTYEGY